MRKINSFLICASLAAFLFIGIGSAQAGVIITTSEATFTAALSSGYYLEDFNRAPWTTIVDPAITSPQSFSSGVWAYNVSATSGLSGQTMPDGGGAVANYYIGQPVTFTFTGQLPTAIGGIFWATDVNGNFLSGQNVKITLQNGSSFIYNDSSNWDGFTGFLSDTPITSVTFQTSNFATIDHFYAASVPEPSLILLLGIGLGSISLVGLRSKK